MTRERLYKKPGRGMYLISVPLAFSRRDVVKNPERWSKLKNAMLENIQHCYRDSLEQAEKDIKSKK